MFKKLGVFLFLLLLQAPVQGVQFEYTTFRLNRYVYYEILYKILGVSPAEFDNVTVISETSLKFVFEYNGQRYTADHLYAGAIRVQMPEGYNDRYLTRGKLPPLILSQYQ